MEDFTFAELTPDETLATTLALEGQIERETSQPKDEGNPLFLRYLAALRSALQKLRGTGRTH